MLRSDDLVFKFSKFAVEQLGDDLPRIEALGRKEITAFLDQDSALGESDGFVHTILPGDLPPKRSDNIYIVAGEYDEDAKRYICYVRVGYFHAADTVPEDHPRVDWRGKEVMLPTTIMVAPNNEFE